MVKHTGEGCKNFYELEKNITLSQYRDLKHCIGFDRKKVKYGKFYEWRNHFFLSVISDNSTWVHFTFLKIADCYPMDEANTMYYLTDLGYEFMAKCENVIIIRE